MNYSDFLSLAENSDIDLSNWIDKTTVYRNTCSVSKHIAMPLEAVCSYYKKGEQIPVSNDYGIQYGILCIVSGCSIDLSSMTDYEYCAYLYEVEKESYALPYNIKNNYFILNIEYYEDYFKTYMKSAPLWGGFIHSEGDIYKKNLKSNILAIKAVANLEFPTKFHTENCFRSVLEPYAFERFLKLYHLFELVFDYDLVECIKQLDSDLQGIGKLLANYNMKEYERLKNIFKRKISNINSVADKLNNLYLEQGYIDKAIEIFLEYGKDANPIKAENKLLSFRDLLNNKMDFTIDNFQAQDIVTDKILKAQEEYKNIIIDLASYFIYRIRCSIAHNRIGEYVMIIDDESFVKDFAEPLIKEVLLQCFT